MKEVVILYGQTITDIAVQELGDAERAMEIAALNGLSLTDELMPGDVLEVPEYDRTKTNIVMMFGNKALAPASMDMGGEDDPEGIDYWIIENDFIVQ